MPPRCSSLTSSFILHYSMNDLFKLVTLLHHECLYMCLFVCACMCLCDYIVELLKNEMSGRLGVRGLTTAQRCLFGECLSLSLSLSHFSLFYPPFHSLSPVHLETRAARIFVSTYFCNTMCFSLVGKVTYFKHGINRNIGR